MTVKFNSPISAARVAHILDVLATPHSGPQLDPIVGLKPSVRCEYLRHLHATEQIHITSWDKGGVAVYVAGAGPDEPRSRFANSSQRRQAHEARQREAKQFETKLQERKNIPAILRGLI